jgi:threonyl-tRNA synthetase
MAHDIEHIRHSLAHLLAAAVLKLYPDAKPTLGPAIDTGFYYDFEFPSPISDEDLPRIEAEMKKILPT